MHLRYVFDEILPSTETDTEQVINTIAALGRRGVDVELMIPRARPSSPLTHDELCAYYQVQGPFRVVELPALSRRYRPLQKAMHSVRAARVKDNFDVWYTRNLSSVAAGLARGHRVAYEHFRPWPDQYPPLEPVLRQMMRHPKFLGAILHSPYALESFRKIGVPEQRLTVICNGFDPGKMEPRLDKSAARDSIGLPRDAKIVVYAGHVNERKGLEVLLDMARQCPDIVFVLVGSQGEGVIEQAARAVPNMRIVPWQRFDKTVVFLYAADVLVIPPSLTPLTQHGTTVLPMKLFTYLATGRVILGPRAEDTASLLNDANAVLVPPGDSKAASRALLEIVADDEHQRALASAARTTAEGFTWAARAERIEGFLERRLSVSDSSSERGEDWSMMRWMTTTARWLEQRMR